MCTWSFFEGRVQNTMFLLVPLNINELGLRTANLERVKVADNVCFCFRHGNIAHERCTNSYKIIKNLGILVQVSM